MPRLAALAVQQIDQLIMTEDELNLTCESYPRARKADLFMNHCESMDNDICLPITKALKFTEFHAGTQLLRVLR